MEQLYIEALLIHWHTGLKFSSENRNPQIPEIDRKNRSIHLQRYRCSAKFLLPATTVSMDSGPRAYVKARNE